MKSLNRIKSYPLSCRASISRAKHLRSQHFCEPSQAAVRRPLQGGNLFSSRFLCYDLSNPDQLSRADPIEHNSLLLAEYAEKNIRPPADLFLRTLQSALVSKRIEQVIPIIAKLSNLLHSYQDATLLSLIYCILSLVPDRAIVQSFLDKTHTLFSLSAIELDSVVVSSLIDARIPSALIQMIHLVDKYSENSTTPLSNLAVLSCFLLRFVSVADDANHQIYQRLLSGLRDTLPSLPRTTLLDVLSLSARFLDLNHYLLALDILLNSNQPIPLGVHKDCLVLYFSLNRPERFSLEHAAKVLSVPIDWSDLQTLPEILTLLGTHGLFQFMTPLIQNYLAVFKEFPEDLCNEVLRLGLVFPEVSRETLIALRNDSHRTYFLSVNRSLQDLRNHQDSELFKVLVELVVEVEDDEETTPRDIRESRGPSSTNIFIDSAIVSSIATHRIFSAAEFLPFMKLCIDEDDADKLGFVLEQVNPRNFTIEQNELLMRYLNHATNGELFKQLKEIRDDSMGVSSPPKLDPDISPSRPNPLIMPLTSVHDYNYVFEHLLDIGGSHTLVIERIQLMQNSGFVFNTRTISILCRLCLKFSILVPYIEKLCTSQESYTYTLNDFYNITKLYFRLNDYLRCQHWFNKFLLMNVKPDASIWSVLAAVYVRIGDIPRYKMIYHNLKHTDLSTADFNDLLDVLLRHHHIQEAEQVLEDMKRYNVPMNATSFAWELKTAAELRHTDKLDEIYLKLSREHLEEKEIRAIIHAYGMSGNMKKVEEYQWELQRRGIIFDPLKAIASATQYMNSQSLMDSLESELRQTGGLRHPVVVAALMQSYGVLKLPDRIRELRKHLRDEGIAPEDQTYAVMCYRFGALGLFDDVNDIEREMNENGHILSSITYKALLYAYSNHPDENIKSHQLSRITDEIHSKNIDLDSKILSPSIISIDALQAALSTA